MNAFDLLTQALETEHAQFKNRLRSLNDEEVSCLIEALRKVELKRDYRLSDLVGIARNIATIEDAMEGFYITHAD